METNINQTLVIQGEQYAQLTEPTVTFSKRMIWINMACLKRFPDIRYVRFMVEAKERKFMIATCKEEESATVRWCTLSRKPRKILCEPDIWNEITKLMGWNDTDRYKLLGKFIQDSSWSGFAFDMTRVIGSSPSFQTLAEHIRNPLVTRFERDTAISLNERG